MAVYLKKQQTAEQDHVLRKVAAGIANFDPCLDIREPDPDSDFFYAEGFKCCIMTLPYFQALSEKLREEVLAADYVSLLEV